MAAEKKTEIEVRLTTPPGLEPLAGGWDALCYLEAEGSWYAAGGRLERLAAARGREINMMWDHYAEAGVTAFRWTGKGWQETRLYRAAGKPTAQLLPILTPHALYRRDRVTGEEHPSRGAEFGPPDAALFMEGVERLFGAALKRKREVPVAVAGVPDADLESSRPTFTCSAEGLAGNQDHVFWENKIILKVEDLSAPRLYRGAYRAGNPGGWRVWVWEGDDWSMIGEGTGRGYAGLRREMVKHYRTTHCQS